MSENEKENRGAVVEQSSVMSEIASAREAQEVQAMVILAKRFPRNPVDAIDRIKNAFTRPALAEVASYEYNRGGTEVEGPSIRAAEAMAQGWGNMIHGVRELEQRDEESTVEAFAWDIETNTRSSKIFQVPHARFAKGQLKKVVDPRDIYEVVANQGARRVRACILAVIPRDVQDEAMAQCKETLTKRVDLNDVKIKAALEAFEKLGVSKAAIERRIQRRVETMSPAQYLQLVRIGNSIRDDMSKAGDWFQEEPSKNDIGEPRAKSEKKPEPEQPKPEAPAVTTQDQEKPKEEPRETPKGPKWPFKEQYEMSVKALPERLKGVWDQKFKDFMVKNRIESEADLREPDYTVLLTMVQDLFASGGR